MSTVLSSPNTSASLPEGHVLQRHWMMFLVMGAIMVVGGTFAVGWACLATLTVMAVWIFGFMLIAGGVGEILNAIWAGRWSGRLLHLLIGAMYLMVGFLFMNEPKEAAERLTLIFAIFMIASGIFRIIFAASERFPGRGSVLINGLITLTLGVLIYVKWPASSQWVIGLFLGIELLFNGWAWIRLALVVRQPATT